MFYSLESSIARIAAEEDALWLNRARMLAGIALYPQSLGLPCTPRRSCWSIAPIMRAVHRRNFKRKQQRRMRCGRRRK